MQVVGRDHFGQVPERGCILVVRVEQDNMRLGILLKDGAEDQRGRARLAGARGAQNGEVLAQHFVHADHGGDRIVLADAANAHRGVGRCRKRLQQFLARGDPDAVPERRIGCNTALESGHDALLVLGQFADQPEFGDPDLGIILLLRWHRHA